MNKRVKFTITSLCHSPQSVQVYRHKHMSEETHSIAWMISWQHLKILPSLSQVSRSKEDTVVLSPAGNLLYHTFLCTCTLPHFLMFQWKVSLQNHHVCLCVHPFSTVVTAYYMIWKWRTKFCTHNVVSVFWKLIFHDCSYLHALASVLVQPSFRVCTHARARARAHTHTHSGNTEDLPLNFFQRDITIVRCSDAEDISNSLAVE
jgi:hypothetical protein